MEEESGGNGSGVVTRKKKTSVYVYTRFPEINDNENEDEDAEVGLDDDLRGSSVHRRVQYVASVAANLGAFALGTVISWPAVALPSLRNDPIFKGNMTATEESWIGSIYALGLVASGPAGGIAIESIGRRGSMLILALPMFMSWLLIHFATSISTILVGRFFTGFFVGTFAVAAPIFTAEVTDVGIRGAVGSSFDMMASIGILFIYIVGTFVDWRAQTLICSIVPVIIFLMMVFVPESPFYLVNKGRVGDATGSLMLYRGAKLQSQVKTELEDMVNEAETVGDGAGFSDLFTAACMLPVFIALMIAVFQVICGLDPVLVYTVDIFAFAGADFSDYTSSIIIGTMETLAGFIALSLVDRSGRRALLLVSEIFMILSLTLLGLYFYLKEVNGGLPPSGLGWLPVTSLATFVLAYSMGVGPVGYTIIGEVLPLQVKGLAGCIITSSKSFITFLTTKFFSDLLEILGKAGTFWLFAGFCILGLAFIYFVVPETKGKSLEEIQRGFRRMFGFRVRDVRETSPLMQNLANNNGNDENRASPERYYSL